MRCSNTEYFVTLCLVTAFFLCFIVMFCSFIPGLGDGNIRRKGKRDVRMRCTAHIVTASSNTQ